MRALRVVLVGAVVIVSACGGGAVKQTGLAGTTTPSPAPSSAASIAATTTTTVTVVATTTALPTSTTAAASTTTAAAGSTASTGASSGPTPSNYTCPDGKPAQNGVCGIDDTVPLRPDIDAVINAYLVFAKENLRISSSPDNPDWNTYLGLIDPAARQSARAEMQGHFDRGERLDTALGVEFHPRSLRVTGRPENVELLGDCRNDGSVWVAATTSEPVDGAAPAMRKRRYVAQMIRLDGKWYVSSFDEDESGCQAND